VFLQALCEDFTVASGIEASASTLNAEVLEEYRLQEVLNHNGVYTRSSHDGLD
jgi:hypothetical protein